MGRAWADRHFVSFAFTNGQVAYVDPNAVVGLQEFRPGVVELYISNRLSVNVVGSASDVMKKLGIIVADD